MVTGAKSWNSGDAIYALTSSPHDPTTIFPWTITNLSSSATTLHYLSDKTSRGDIIKIKSSNDEDE